MEDIYAVVAVFDDHDYEDAYFRNPYYAEHYARYRKQRSDFENHPGIFQTADAFNVDRRVLFESDVEAIEDFEKLHGPPKSGAERFAELQEKNKSQQYRMVLISENEYEEFKAWQTAHAEEKQ